jgi:hypothetical protein
MQGAWEISEKPGSPGIRRRSQRRIDGAALGLALYVGTCCTVTAGFGFGLYELLQPRRVENLGLAAYKPPPAAVIEFVGMAGYARAAEAELEPEPMPAAIEPVAETPDPLAPKLQIAREIRKAKPQSSKRLRAAHRKQRRDPMMGYAFQPSSGRYRMWY